ncbi:hypothetical protein JX266_009630 [Neoarthrinium moseri]|nr:hypothetical protein JX266_009630 [Neoarthrinium moseri]
MAYACLYLANPGNTHSQDARAGTNPLEPDPDAATAPAASAGSPSSAPGPHKRGLSISDAACSPAESNASAVLEDRRTKRQRSTKGSRGVANLTPEQLAKKRENDRQSQRLIRERTKTQIETLHAEIRELKSQQPYQELQAAVRQKEAVEAEMADLKRRMASIMNLIQPVLGAQQGTYASPGTSTLMPNQPGLVPAGVPPPGNNAASTPPSTASPLSADPSWHQGGIPSAGSSTQASPNFNQANLIIQQRQNSLHALDLNSTGEQLKLDFLLDPSLSDRMNRLPPGVGEPQDAPGYVPPWNGISMPSPRSGSLAQVSAQLPNHTRQPQSRSDYAYYAPESNVPAQTPPPWAGFTAPIKNCSPTSPLDHLLLDFLHERRQRAAEGVPTQDIVGPRYPSVSSLLNSAVFSHPLSKVFTDILATFPGVRTLPERVAILYIMFLIMRWQISPTKENYDRLPDWVRPTPSQIHVAHPAWIDHLPFPLMREKIAKEYNPTQYLFDNFFVPFTATISLNWPYEETDALLMGPDDVEMINPVFERHLRRNENWTLGEQFHRDFPQLEGTYNLKRDPRASWSANGGGAPVPGHR